MSTLIHNLLVFLDDIEHLLSKEYIHSNPKKLFFDYLRIRTKASLHKWFHFREERFLSYRIIVPDYYIFLAEFRQIFVHHVYYSETKKRNPRIIDCGGNIGISVLYWKYLFPDAEVLVFEPSTEVVNVLRKNIFLNNLQGVEIVEAAVSDTQGESTIYTRGFKAEGNTLSKDIWESTPIKHTVSETDVVSYKVQTKKLSEYIRHPIDILKLDIEGNEGRVLKEITDTGKFISVKECILEYHYYPTMHENRLEDILTLFKRRGFEAQVYFEERSSKEQLALMRSGSYALGIRSITLG